MQRMYGPVRAGARPWCWGEGAMYVPTNSREISVMRGIKVYASIFYGRFSCNLSLKRILKEVDRTCNNHQKRDMS